MPEQPHITLANKLSYYDDHAIARVRLNKAVKLIAKLYKVEKISSHLIYPLIK